MSEFTTLIIEKPKWFRITPIKTGFGQREPYVIGWDSEAYRGAPFLFQFGHPTSYNSPLPRLRHQRRQDVDLLRVTTANALDEFVSYMEPVAHDNSHKRQVVVVGWNLRYEYTQLFAKINPDAWEDTHFQLHWHEVGQCGGTPDDEWSIKLDALNDKRYAFDLEYGKGKRKVRVIDGMAFFNTSLAAAAKIVGVEDKETRPGDLGKVRPSVAMADPTFVHYAEQDARTTQQIGEKIIGFHQYYDVKLTISAPMFASQVFRRKYLNAELPLADQEVEDAGLRAYHGGKNGYYASRPHYIADAFDYDLNGAYTSAMAVLPDPVSSVWDEVDRYEPGVHGLWFIRARVQSCVYRAFQHNSGRWYTWRDDGDLEFWITSYELDEAMRHGEVLDIYECTGFVLRGPEASGCLRQFCDDMYHQKRFAETAEERQMAKLCLNSIYGKMIQKVPNSASSVFPMFEFFEDTNGQVVVSDANMVEGGYKAGGLYHPGLAALVTGNVRAVIHGREHKYQSLMTSTDGFLSTVPPDETDIGPEVGKLKVKRGSLSIWRERLYVFDPTGDHDPTDECKIGCDGNHPVFALHGFRGRLADLRAIPLEPGTFSYQAQSMVGLRDSLHMHGGRRYRPGQFATLPYTLDLTNVNERSPVR